MYPLDTCTFAPSDTAFWVLLDPRPSLLFNGGTSTLFPSEPPHSSRSQKLTSGAVETLSISIATHQFSSSSQRSSPRSLVAARGPHRVPQVCDQSDSAESLGIRPPHRDDTDIPKHPENRLLPSSQWCRLASRIVVATSRHRPLRVPSDSLSGGLSGILRCSPSTPRWHQCS